ncbi:hypothetical protein [Kineococcus sp. SYSU DK018]|uniref:hypothetical protein n=1 Tax=Kineococcus sp. SYSU DK018 TaxID=3383139 RepID=UPI003D7DCFC7
MGGDAGVVAVHLLGVPLRLRESFNEHTQELLRELALVQIGAGHEHVGALPQRLLRLAEDVETTYASFQERPVAALEAASAAGREFADVTYEVPARAGAFTRHLLDVLEQADDFCREQQLLTLPAPPALVAYRRWLLGEFTRQLAGAEPRPWAGTGATGVAAP